MESAEDIGREPTSGVPVTGMDVELAAHYAQARRQRPLAPAEDIATRIIEWLTDDELLVLAGEALGWHQEPAGRRELALLAVRNFVAAMEDGPP